MNCAASLSRVAADISASFARSPMRVTIVSGKPAGPIMPIQASASTSMPASFSVGMSGSSAERFAVETARIFIAPLCTWGTTEIAGRQAICTSSRMSAVTACGEEE